MTIFRAVKNVKKLRAVIGCEMKKDCNSCGFRDGCIKRAIRLGWKER